jgi:hypothetical protein
VEYTTRQEKNTGPNAKRAPTREVPDQPVNRNIRWRVTLPRWGNGAPLPVAGRVFVVCEPWWKSDWPVLCRFRATEGTLLWQRELNHLAATDLSPEAQEKVLTTWREAGRLNGEHWRNSCAVNAASGAEREALEARLRAEDRSFTSGTSCQACKSFISQAERKARAAVQDSPRGLRGKGVRLEWKEERDEECMCVVCVHGSPDSRGMRRF